MTTCFSQLSFRPLFKCNFLWYQLTGNSYPLTYHVMLWKKTCITHTNIWFYIFDYSFIELWTCYTHLTTHISTLLNCKYNAFNIFKVWNLHHNQFQKAFYHPHPILPSVVEVEAGGLWIPGQSGLHNETVSTATKSGHQYHTPVILATC
jgi:hypothetical protein